jgi:hypothetical protein
LNKRSLIFTWLILALSLGAMKTASAENNPTADSLYAVIDATENDTIKIDLLIALSEEFIDNDKTKAIRYTQLCIKVSYISRFKNPAGLYYEGYG